jgi:hypothetical protein
MAPQAGLSSEALAEEGKAGKSEKEVKTIK